MHVAPSLTAVWCLAAGPDANPDGDGGHGVVPLVARHPGHAQRRLRRCALHPVVVVFCHICRLPCSQSCVCPYTPLWIFRDETPVASVLQAWSELPASYTYTYAPSGGPLPALPLCSGAASNTCCHAAAAAAVPPPTQASSRRPLPWRMWISFIKEQLPATPAQSTQRFVRRGCRRGAMAPVCTSGSCPGCSPAQRPARISFLL